MGLKGDSLIGRSELKRMLKRQARKSVGEGKKVRSVSIKNKEGDVIDTVMRVINKAEKGKLKGKEYILLKGKKYVIHKVFSMSAKRHKFRIGKDYYSLSPYYVEV